MNHEFAQISSGSENLWTGSDVVDGDPQIDESISPGSPSRADGYVEAAGSNQAGQGDSLMVREEQCQRLFEALGACHDLRLPSEQTDALWLAMRDTICTKHVCRVVPLGSRVAVEVPEEYAGLELAEAMTWLRKNEGFARTLSPEDLFRRLRAAGTKGATGSARMAQQDQLRGVTGVAAGQAVCFEYLDIASFERVQAS